MSNTKFAHLVILVLLSVAIAAACYFLGGIIANVTGATPFLGITFQAGGALAGFLISFVALLTAYQKMVVSIPLCKVTVSTATGPFSGKGDPYTAQATIMKFASGKATIKPVAVIWEAAGLTVHLRDVELDDLMMVTVTDCKGKTMQSRYFSPLCSSQVLK